MANALTPKLGNYSLDWESDSLTPHLSHIEVDLGLGEVGQMRVRLSLTSKKWQALTNQSFPQSASFKWQQRGIFQGDMVRATLTAPARLDLLFEDSLQLARKTHDNQYLKKVSLSDVLSRLCHPLKLSPIFQGSFDDLISAYNLSGGSYWDHLQFLSAQYGFFLSNRSVASQIQFIRLGSEVTQIQLDAKTTSLNQTLHSQHTAGTFANAEVRHFSGDELQSKQKMLSQSDLYGSLGNYGQHSGFRGRQKWASAQGSFEAPAAQADHFEMSHSLLKSQAGKLAMGQERITLGLFEPIALPGDQLNIKNLSNTQDGAYLVESLRIRVRGALPQMDLNAIRA